MTREGLAALAVGGAVVVAVVLGLMRVGPPGEARRERLDERRLGDLGAIVVQLGHYAQARDGALPETLDEIAGRLPGRRGTVDPVSGEPYPYEPAGAGRYRLCARFDSAGPHELPPRPGPQALRIERGTVEGAGLGCFILAAGG